MRWLFVILVSLGLMGVAGWMVYQTPAAVSKGEKASSQNDFNAPIRGNFRLLDTEGKVRTDQEFRGKYLLVYFGYALGPDACPLALSNISEALVLLKRDIGQIVTIFIALDLDRGSKEAVKNYKSILHPNVIILTGTQSDLDPVLKGYRIYSAKHQEGSNDYLVDHSTLIYLMDRQGKLVQIFPHTTPAKDLSQAIGEILRQEAPQH